MIIRVSWQNKSGTQYYPSLVLLSPDPPHPILWRPELHQIQRQWSGSQAYKLVHPGHTNNTSRLCLRDGRQWGVHFLLTACADGCGQHVATCFGLRSFSSLGRWRKWYTSHYSVAELVVRVRNGNWKLTFQTCSHQVRRPKIRVACFSDSFQKRHMPQLRARHCWCESTTPT